MKLTEKQIANFNKKLQLSTTGCLEWTGCLESKGYGNVHIRGCGLERENQRTHRVAWFLKNGEIPNGLFVLHHCDNPKCCNPDHLFLGTHLDNMQDMAKKDRSNGFNKNPETQKIAVEKAKSEEARQKRKETFDANNHQQGDKNSQYGSKWICNHEMKRSAKVKKDFIIPGGWVHGRVQSYESIKLY